MLPPSYNIFFEFSEHTFSVPVIGSCLTQKNMKIIENLIKKKRKLNLNVDYDMYDNKNFKDLLITWDTKTCQDTGFAIPSCKLSNDAGQQEVTRFLKICHLKE